MAKFWMVKSVGALALAYFSILAFLSLQGELNLSDFTEASISASVLFIVPAFLLLYALRVLRLSFLSDGVVQMVGLYKIISFSSWWSIVLPAKTGELSFLVFLKKHGVSHRQGAAWLLVSRGFDVLIPALVLCQRWVELPLIVLGIAVLTVISVLLRYVQSSRSRGISWVRANLSKDWYFRETQVELVEIITSPKLVVAYVVSVVQFGIVALIFQIYFHSLGESVAFREVIYASSFPVVSALVPLNAPGNIGTLDVGWMYGFSSIGVESVVVLQAAVLMHVGMIVMAGLHALLALLLSRMGVQAFRQRPVSSV